MEKCLSEMTERVLSTRPVCLSSTSETGKSLHRSTDTPTGASQARHLKRSQGNCVAADWHPPPTTPSKRSSGNELQSNTIISARLRCESCAFNPYNEIEEEKALAMGSYRMYCRTDKHIHREKLEMMNPVPHLLPKSTVTTSSKPNLQEKNLKHPQKIIDKMGNNNTTPSQGFNKSLKKSLLPIQAQSTVLRWPVVPRPC